VLCAQLISECCGINYLQCVVCSIANHARSSVHAFDVKRFVSSQGSVALLKQDSFVTKQSFFRETSIILPSFVTVYTSNKQR